MTLTQAFDALKSARRNDNGSALSMMAIHQAAMNMALIATGEATHRLLNQQQVTEPEPAPIKDQFSFENVRKLLGQ